MTTEAQPQIYAALIAVLADVNAIEKTKTASGFGAGYKFRGIDDVYNALHPLLAKHGVFAVPELVELTQQEKQTKSGNAALWTVVKMRYRFFARDGSSVESITAGEAMDTGDKSIGKAQSYAHKVALLQTFAIPTDDDNDTENTTHELASPQPSGARRAPQERPPARESREPGQKKPSARETKLVAALKSATTRADLKTAGALSDADKAACEAACPGFRDRLRAVYDARWKELPAVAPTPAATPAPAVQQVQAPASRTVNEDDIPF